MIGINDWPILVDHPAIGTLLRSATGGDPEATRQLYAALYVELKRMARRELSRIGGGLTLSASTLLHETYLKLARNEEIAFPDESRFMAYAARAMRGLVIDYARSKRAYKRGGEFEMTSLPTDLSENHAAVVDATQLQKLNDAVDELARIDVDLAELVDLKYFSGFSFVEIARLRGVTERTVYRHWEKARIFLFHALEEAGEKEQAQTTSAGTGGRE